MRGADDDHNCSWLSDQMVKALPISVRLACDLFHDWTDLSHGFLKKPDVFAIRERMRHTAQACFSEKNALAMTKALDMDHPYALRWLVMPPRSQWGPSIVDTEQWTWFAGTLLAAARIDPERMVVQIGHLLTETTGDAPDGRIVIPAERVQSLFGDRREEVLRLLAQELNPTAHSDKHFLRMVREAAARLLASPDDSDVRPTHTA
jgi:hypothetical protein